LADEIDRAGAVLLPGAGKEPEPAPIDHRGGEGERWALKERPARKHHSDSADGKRRVYNTGRDRFRAGDHDKRRGEIYLPAFVRNGCGFSRLLLWRCYAALIASPR
jgi:hypothetical protein